MPAIIASKACAVHILLVARSLFICCSLVCRAILRAYLPLESCETPIIVSMTGGLKEQVTDGENWFGYGIEPVSKGIIGSGAGVFGTHYIYEDRLCEKDFVDTLVKFYNLPKEESEALGKAGKKHVEKNYSFDTLEKTWLDLFDSTIEKHGSWDTRKNYKPYEARVL